MVTQALNLCCHTGYLREGSGNGGNMVTQALNPWCHTGYQGEGSGNCGNMVTQALNPCYHTGYQRELNGNGGNMVTQALNPWCHAGIQRERSGYCMYYILILWVRMSSLQRDGVFVLSCIAPFWKAQFGNKHMCFNVIEYLLFYMPLTTYFFVRSVQSLC